MARPAAAAVPEPSQGASGPPAGSAVNGEEARRQEIEAGFDQISDQHRDFIENLEREVPALRPFAAEEVAQELRRQALELEEQAAAIERAETRNMLLEWLRTCRTKANHRSGGA
jgi:hypothetical protein